MGHTWDPHLYLAYADERERSFRGHGVVMPFRRVFVAARVPERR